MPRLITLAISPSRAIGASSQGFVLRTSSSHRFSILCAAAVARGRGLHAGGPVRELLDPHVHDRRGIALPLQLNGGRRAPPRAGRPRSGTGALLSIAAGSLAIEASWFFFEIRSRSGWESLRAGEPARSNQRRGLSGSLLGRISAHRPAHWPALRLLEIGSSAGLNLCWDDSATNAQRRTAVLGRSAVLQSVPNLVFSNAVRTALRGLVENSQPGRGCEAGNNSKRQCGSALDCNRSRAASTLLR